MTRREFLKNSSRGLALAAFSSYVPGFLANSIANDTPLPEKYRKILVIVQLAGGNDGLNTFIPFEDDNYYKLRPNLGIKKSDGFHKINDLAALHPSCSKMAELYKSGMMSVIQNVGYPNPNRSHFRSTEIWETASNDSGVYDGWIGRYLDNECCGSPDKKVSLGKDVPDVVNIGNSLPDSIISQKNHNLFSMSSDLFKKNKKNKKRKNKKRKNLKNLASDNSFLNDITNSVHIGDEEQDASVHYLKQTLLNSLVTEKRVLDVISKYRPMYEYPSNNFGLSLRNIASMIASGLETRVYFAHLGGFDTHRGQVGNHTRLLKTLSDGIFAFQNDLKKHGLEDQVMTMTFSEFGRRPYENSSAGTDHGTSAPLFIFGSENNINNNLVGKAPSLDIGDNKDLDYDIDFRQVYSTVLNKWLEAPSDKIISGKFSNLNFI